MKKNSYRVATLASMATLALPVQSGMQGNEPVQDPEVKKMSCEVLRSVHTDQYGKYSCNNAVITALRPLGRRNVYKKAMMEL